VSASNPIEWWEQGVTGAPPRVLKDVLQMEERLLWTARVGNRAAMKPILWLALFFLVGAVVFALSAPWGETRESYCGLKPLNSCLRFYYSSTLVTVTSSMGFLWLIWKYHKDTRSHWAMRYAITDKRAIAIDERTPDKVRWAYLGTRRAKIHFGSLTFGAKSSNAVAFSGLDAFRAERALYWATDGRQRSLHQAGELHEPSA
jgi:hypothetical protein